MGVIAGPNRGSLGDAWTGVYAPGCPTLVSPPRHSGKTWKSRGAFVVSFVGMQDGLVQPAFHTCQIGPPVPYPAGSFTAVAEHVGYDKLAQGHYLHDARFALCDSLPDLNVDGYVLVLST